MKTQGRANLVQFVHGCCLSHLSFRRRHSRHEVIRRFLRRMRGCSLCAFLSPTVLGEALDAAPCGGDAVGNDSGILAVFDVLWGYGVRSATWRV